VITSLQISRLKIRYSFVISLTRSTCLDHLQGKSPWYPLDRRLGGPQSHSGRGGLEKNSQPPPGIEPQNPIVQPVAQRYTNWGHNREDLVSEIHRRENLKSDRLVDLMDWLMSQSTN
jgi:hypothetical protein